MDETKRILMCGSRTWQNGHAIADEIFRLKKRYGDNLQIIHGDEPNGADDFIRHWCDELNVYHVMCCAGTPRYEEHSMMDVVLVARWDVDGKRAGYLRNTYMRGLNPSGCVAFRSEGKSNGTDMMIELCAERGTPRIVYLEDGRRMVGT